MYSRRPGALFVALVFLFQWVVAASASGLAPTAPQLDAFGNPLCITGPAASTTTAPADHAKVSACCTTGCHLASCDMAGHERLTALPLIVFPSMVQQDLVATDDASTVRLHDPGRPRAPPVLV